MYDMYRLLAIAKYDERYVIPPAHAEQAPLAGGARHRVAGAPWTTTAARAWAAPDRSARPPAAPTPIAVENFQMLQDRQTTDTLVDPADRRRRGQPAQLGRQGRRRRAVPAHADGPDDRRR